MCAAASISKHSVSIYHIPTYLHGYMVPPICSPEAMHVEPWFFHDSCPLPPPNPHAPMAVDWEYSPATTHYRPPPPTHVHVHNTKPPPFPRPSAL